MPYGVETIKFCAFLHSHNLETLIISSKIKTIEQWSISTMNNLNTIIYSSSTTQTNTKVFNEINPSVKIIVGKNYPSDSFCGKTVTKIDIQCGDNIFGIVDESIGYFYMYGTGSTYTYTHDSIKPIDAHNEIITTIVMEEGITTLGEMAFTL